MRGALTALGITAAILMPSAAGAFTTVERLVYQFSYSQNQNTTARDSANPAEDYGNAGALAAGNGISHYTGTLNDKGTMTVQILGKQADGGLIVSIAESGENTRRAPAADCVVYGDTRVICDPNKTVYPEEYTLLRFLGQNFVDAAKLDKDRHWQIVQDSPTTNVTADYVLGPTNTTDVTISETRKIRQVGGGSLTTDISTKIGYDLSREIPTSIDEYAQQRHDDGVQGTSTTLYQTTLTLLSNTAGNT